MADITKQIKNANSDQEIIEIIKNAPRDEIDFPSLSYKEAILAIKAGCSLGNFSKRMQTPEMCEIAIDVDGNNIVSVSKRLITKELCYKAVGNCSRFDVLYYVPDQFIDKRLIRRAVRHNGEALAFVPDDMITLSLCYDAVKSNGRALRAVPAEFKKEKELLMCAIQSSGLALQYVPKNRRTKALCLEAVKLNPFALEFVPERLKSDAVCLDAINANWATLAFAPLQCFTKEIVAHALRCAIEENKDSSRSGHERFKFRMRILDLFRKIPEPLHNEPEIRSLELKLGLRTISEKYYSSSDHLFHVIENGTDITFSDFDSFYQYLEGDLSNSDLRDFSFNDVDPGVYSFDGARLNATAEKHLALSDYTIYDQIREKSPTGFFLQTKANEIVAADSVLHELAVVEAKEEHQTVYYISDIHIANKIAKEFPSPLSRMQIIEYIDTVVEKMVQSAPCHSENDYLLIAGDVSFDFQVSEIFYRALAKHWKPSRIIVVLGNHELWDCSESESSKKLETVISKFRTLFSELKIVFLQNELFVEHTKWNREILTYEKLMAASPVDIEDLCEQSSLIVLGGIGFSGYNQDFNANHNIYQDTIQSYEEDLRQTQLFENLYEHVDAALWNRTVIVLTHMPKADWSREEYNPNWIYVSGHTHFNDFYCGKEKTFYADNQIGYNNTSISLKWFYTKKVYGSFDFYPDGIFSIDRKEYLDYMRARQIVMEYTRSDGQIFMLKRCGFFCFLLKKQSGDLFILNGGQEKRLEHNDVNFIYDEMSLYGNFVDKVFEAYYNALKSISASVKQLGGVGTIHGSIVDIDFLNHVSLNPIDGTITCYFATSPTNKIVYKNIVSLLKASRPDLYQKYLRLLEKDNQNNLLKEENAIEPASDFGIFVSDTSMYRASRRLRSFQYILEQRIIRIWDERVIDLMKKEVENNSFFIDPSETLSIES